MTKHLPPHNPVVHGDPNNSPAVKRNYGKGGRSLRSVAAELVDEIALQLTEEFADTPAEKVFRKGFSPMKELMRLYGEEKCKPEAEQNFITKYTLCREMLPYLYPKLKSIEYSGDRELPALTVLLQEEADDGKEKTTCGIVLQSKTKPGS